MPTPFVIDNQQHSLAGLTDAEAEWLEKRLETML